MQYLRLGASLYVPATHHDIINIATGTKFKNLKSVIFDTEDSITSDDLPAAYKNINMMLDAIEDKSNRPLVFIRVRNPHELKRVYTFENIKNIDGFVLPKLDLENMHEYFTGYITDKLYMPILEKNIFSIARLEKIRDFLINYQENILSLRIGATDLLSSLNMRRSCSHTIYEIGIMNQTIANIVSIFKPYGFNITGSVWESFDEGSKALLQEETYLDLLNGLFGKSIIHPYQIEIVEEMYKVSKEDFEIAEKLVADDCPAVFKAYNKMNEKATHANWAENILKRAEIYGIKED